MTPRRFPSIPAHLQGHYGMVSSRSQLPIWLAYNTAITTGLMRAQWKLTSRRFSFPTSMEKEESWSSILTTEHLWFLTNSMAKGQRVFFNFLEDNHIHVVMVPVNCTDRLEPLDISFNKPAKAFLRQQFHKWYAEQICQQLQDKTNVTPVDLWLSVVKPLEAQWMIQLYDYRIEENFRMVQIFACSEHGQSVRK